MERGWLFLVKFNLCGFMEKNSKERIMDVHTVYGWTVVGTSLKFLAW